MTFNDFLIYANEYARARPKLRIGQAYFNALVDTSPAIATAILSTPADPYYDNDRIADFLTEVGNLWA